MRSFRIAIVAAALALLTSVPAAAAVAVYAYSAAAIYSINLTNGAATALYNFGVSLETPAGLAVRPSDGLIFFQTRNTTSGVVTTYSYDPGNPANAPVTIGTSGTTYTPRLAFGSDNNLYAMDTNATAIYQISQTTGAATQVATLTGSPGTNLGGDMVIGPDGATVYFVVNQTLYRVPLSGGAIVTVGNITGLPNGLLGGNITGLAIDSSGRLIMAGSQTNTGIYALPSLTNLAAITLGNSGSTSEIGDLGSAPAVDLVLSKSHSGYFVSQGPVGTYTLVVTNAGTANSSGTITVTDTLPAGLTYSSASGTGWTCSNSGQTVTCTSAAALAAFGGVSNAISLGVTASPAAVPSVTNTAVVSGGNERPFFAGNDSASDLTFVGGLTIVKTANKTSAAPGDTIVYTLTFANNNPSSGGKTLNTIVVSDVTPANTTFVAAACGTLPSGVTCSVSSPAVGATGTVKWTLGGNLAIGATGTVSLTVKVN